MTIIDVVQGDITAVAASAIVNAANTKLLGGGGVDGAIHRAGGPTILAECKVLRATTLPHGLDVGAAVATTAGRLRADYVIHTVGPRYSLHEDRSELLRSCYARSLALAASMKSKSVAFPLISGGSFGWPMHEAVTQQVVAVKAARPSVELVMLVAYSRESADLTRRLVG
ncbi:O-acetyl-ADP-ribose deacetylase [Rhodococcus sp. KRD162]|uniref:O-acetyl-ADP-ribose deacetylase n=1 Tax=Rhodococcus sp. KRD162 TaxID=2729725 RepID=UPI0019CFF0AA|nr:O-acetyl-ADP-ribose deacetylase [Rhodococcus sp. KRD162]